MSVTPKVRLAVFQRDNFMCVACGSGANLTVHHRINRGMGGSKTVDTPAHLLTMCNLCNTSFESDYEAAAAARRKGYKLSKNATPPIDPTQVAVFYWSDSMWYFLTDKTKRIKVNGK